MHGIYAVRRISTCLSQTAIWLQLVKVWVTTFQLRPVGPFRCLTSLRLAPLA
jgi:hypothetical protein